MTTADIKARDTEEARRSALEASHTILSLAEIDRYLLPPVDTVYPLEFAFHLLGNVSGSRVLDLGCGSGETVVPLIRRGARVIALDISPELVSLIDQRLGSLGLSDACECKVASAYETGIESGSIDVIFAMSVLHHLDVALATKEMFRILKPGGTVVLKEPVRYSSLFRQARKLFPAKDDVSEYEYPLSHSAIATIVAPFEVVSTRHFRLPFVPLFQKFGKSWGKRAFRVDRWLLSHFPALSHFATVRVMKLAKR